MLNLKPTLTFILFLFSIALFAQEVTVLDADTGIPIDNIAVFNKDQSKTAVTDAKGKIDLEFFSDDDDSLVL